MQKSRSTAEIHRWRLDVMGYIQRAWHRALAWRGEGSERATQDGRRIEAVAREYKRRVVTRIDRLDY